MKYVHTGAVLSSDCRYRYRLWREWRGNHQPQNWRWLGGVDGSGTPMGEPKACVFVMLNPSTAGAMDDDPTIRKCVGFADRWGYERLEVVNLFAHRATSPQALLKLNHNDDPVGAENQAHVERAVRNAGLVVCAWGINGVHLGQDETVLGWIEDWGVQIACLGEPTAGGYPRHPLYVPYSCDLQGFNGSRK